jgi:hypothetical protein
MEPQELQVHQANQEPLAVPENLAPQVPMETPANKDHPAAANTAHRLVWPQDIKRRQAKIQTDIIPEQAFKFDADWAVFSKIDSYFFFNAFLIPFFLKFGFQ